MAKNFILSCETVSFPYPCLEHVIRAVRLSAATALTDFRRQTLKLSQAQAGMGRMTETLT